MKTFNPLMIPTMLTLAVASVGLFGPPLIASMDASTTVTKYTTGIATIGDNDSTDGDSSSGVFNVDEGVEPATVLLTAIHHSSRIHFLKGTYKFGVPFATGRSNVMITADPGAVFTTTSGNTATAGQIFAFTGGSRLVLSGINVDIANWDNSASAIKFTDCKDILVTGCRFVASTTAVAVSPLILDQNMGDIESPDLPDVNPAFSVVSVVGSTSTPMAMLEFYRCNHKRVFDSVFLPNYAWTMVKTTYGSGLQFSRNYIGNDVDGGLGGNPLTDNEPFLATPRLCYRVIDLFGDEWGMITSNRFWALGDYAGLSYDTNGNVANTEAVPMDVGIQITQGDEASTIENGHHLIATNNVELCPTQNGMIRLWGGSGSYIFANMIGFNGNTPNELTEAAIVLDDSNGSTAGLDSGGGAGGNVNIGTTIAYNNLHNLAASDTAGSFIYMRKSQDVKLIANSFDVVACDYPIEIASANCARIQIAACTFDALDAASPLSPIHLNTGGAITGGIAVSGCLYYGFDNAACVVNESGSTTNYYLEGLKDLGASAPYTSAFAASSSITFDTTNDSILGTGLFTNFATGDPISVGGADDAPNNIVTVITNKVSNNEIRVSANLTTDAASTGTVRVRKLAAGVTANIDMD